MATVPETTATRKPQAFYAHMFDQEGALTRVNGVLYFVGDDGTVVEIEPSMVNFLVVLGSMHMADAQRIEDLMRGGYAAVACSREQEVR